MPLRFSSTIRRRQREEAVDLLQHSLHRVPRDLLLVWRQRKGRSDRLRRRRWLSRHLCLCRRLLIPHKFLRLLSYQSPGLLSDHPKSPGPLPHQHKSHLLSHQLRLYRPLLLRSQSRRPGWDSQSLYHPRGQYNHQQQVSEVRSRQQGNP